MSSKHTIRVTLPHGDPDIGAEIEADITYTYSHGVPATRMTPGYGDTLDFVSVRPLCNGKPSPFDGAFADLKQDWLDDLASDWLASDAGYAEACEHAEADIERAREFQAELRAEQWAKP